MVDSVDEPPLDPSRSIQNPSDASSRANSNSLSASDSRTLDPLKDPNTSSLGGSSSYDAYYGRNGVAGLSPVSASTKAPTDSPVDALPPPAPPPTENRHGDQASAIEPAEEPEMKPNIFTRFFRTCKEILFSSWINTLLVFVPVGIAVQFTSVSPNIVFAMNAIAIIPLAGSLSYATESVASEMGDTIGSLMNVTFGNAVELIIFIIALTKNEIRIVQASLLGSILANLLLILGMCFLLGGLRFREQIYNSVVTQMSACLLSLSVMSLLLPTAFHASFTDNTTADRAVLHVSRGTSVILLLVYVLYLLFQLKSHAYMYQSTPQHVIDEESHPGVLHDMLNSSSSCDSSDSSSSASDTTSGSVTTAKRIKRVLRVRKRRKSSASSKDGQSGPSTLRSGSLVAITTGDQGTMKTLTEGVSSNAIASGDEADTDGERDANRRTPRNFRIGSNDTENEKADSNSDTRRKKRRIKKKGRKFKIVEAEAEASHNEKSEKPAMLEVPSANRNPPIHNRPSLHVQGSDGHPDAGPRRSFNLGLRGLTVRDVVPTIMPIEKVLAGTVFSSANPTGPAGMTVNATAITAAPGNPPQPLHRSTSLPSRLNQAPADRRASHPPPGSWNPSPYTQPIAAAPAPGGTNKDSAAHKNKLSRTSAILLLLISTALVAVCAEFLVGSIDYLVLNSPVSEAFIGLIILPIVGNAAEHVTAVTVAAKNKMDLAIGVAVGSSIQIALFVTPVIVLLGWALGKDMSLYFSLFETISLFVSAFIVNFLVLDGRSNYLEGALLIAAYVIIAVAAFFYPDSDEQSTVGGGDAHERGGGHGRLMMRSAVVDVAWKAVVGGAL